MLFDFQNCSGDVAGGVVLVEVINNEDAVFGEHDGPRVTEVAAAAIVAEDGFGCSGEVGAFGIKDTGANAHGRMAITVDEKDTLIRQSQGIKGMAHKAGVFPVVKRFAAIGGTGDAGVVAKILATEEGDEIALGVS